MSNPVLSRAIEGFLLNLSAGGRSENTIRNYRTDLNRFSEWIENPPVDEITSKQLEAFMVYMRNEFRISHAASTPIKPRKISTKTLANTHGTLTVFWKWVSKEFNIANPFTVSPIKVYAKPILPFNGKEVEKLLIACRQSQKAPKMRKAYSSKRQTYKRDKSIILLLLDSGMRVSELCGIDIRDVDIERGRILVTGKGNKTRFVYIGKVCKQSLWGYIAERFPNDTPPLDEPLFVDQYGIHRMTRFSVLTLLKRLGNTCQITSIYPHRFRHTFAVEFLKNGGNVFELQQLLGHATIDMVQNYVKIAQVDLEISARKASPADRWRLR